MTPIIKDKVIRYANRASYDKSVLMQLLNRNFICNLGFVDHDVPYIIPMMYVNDEEYIFLHGSPNSRLINILKSGATVAISVTEINGIVLAKRTKNNSVNYNSALVFGRGEELSGFEEKLAVFKRLVDRVLPERWENSIAPSEVDLKAVNILRLKIMTYSVKRREGSPNREKTDDNKIWDGVIPIVHKFGIPEDYQTDIPGYIQNFLKSNARLFYKTDEF